MPRETLLENIRRENLAKLMGVTEESTEEERQLYKEEASRMQRISDDFVLFQDKVREEFDRHRLRASPAGDANGR
jgi:radical SAM superfamily enzyme with C-terminal helix-hairpin-helix motif